MTDIELKQNLPNSSVSSLLLNAVLGIECSTVVSFSLNERDFTIVPKNSLPTARSIQDIGYR